MADPMNSLAGKRVLIAEDEPLIAVDHRSVLSEAGAEIVGTCSTVAHALQCLDCPYANADNALASCGSVRRHALCTWIVLDHPVSR